MCTFPEIRGKTCVVLGGGGFLGAQLCPMLVASGANVRAFGRSHYYDAPFVGVTWHRGDFHDLSALASMLEGADVVFHLISCSTPASAEANRLHDLQSNVGGTLSLLELCRAVEVHRVVFASSGGTVYGPRHQPPFTETMLPRPISSYGVGKLVIEHYLSLYNHSYGMQNVSLRISNPYGPYQHASKNQGVVPIFARNILAGNTLQIWGDGSVIRDYIYGPDVAEAFIAAATYQGREEVFNIGSGQGTSLLQVIETLEQILGCTPKLMFKPSRRFDSPASVLDISLAARELQWAPRTAWMDGMRAAMAWLIEDMGIRA